MLDLLDISVIRLCDFPEKATLTTRHAVLGVVHFTASRDRARELVAAGEVVWTPTEYEPLARALAERTAVTEVFRVGTRGKRVDALYRVRRPDLPCLGGPPPPSERVHWSDDHGATWWAEDASEPSWRRLLGHLRLSLVDVVWDGGAGGGSSQARKEAA